MRGASFRRGHEEAGRADQEREDQRDERDDHGLAGLTQIVASDSSKLMKMDARIEPPRFPMPPTTTTTNARSVKSNPIAWLMPTVGPNSTPAAAAMPAPIAKTTVCTNGTGMPIASAMTRSCVVARIQMPCLPYFMKRKSPPMMAPDIRAITSRYHGYSM